MGKTLHNTIYLGRKGFAARRWLGAAAALMLAAVALGAAALR